MSAGSVLLAWRPAHVDDSGLDQGGHPITRVLPLNQRAWQAMVERGLEPVVRPWEMADASLIETSRSMANDALRSWRDKVASAAASTGLDADIASLDAARIWLALREYHYCRLLLTRSLLELPVGSPLRVPSAVGPYFSSWYGGNDLPALAMRAIQHDGPVEWLFANHETVALPEQCEPLPPPIAGTTPWQFVHLPGLTDPVFHIDRALRREGYVRVCHDRELSGDVEHLKARFAKNPRVQFLGYANAHTVGIAPVTDALAERWAAGEPVLRHAMAELWPRHASMAKQLDELFRREGPPASVLASDHASPEGLMILKRAAAAGAPGILEPHASHMMQPPFLMLPPASPRWTLHVPTRLDLGSARQWLAGNPAHLDVRPSPRFRVGPRRIARMALRMLRWPKRVVRIGIVITTGEAVHVPDIPITPLLDDIRRVVRIPPALQGKVELRIRLREFEDSLLLFRQVVGTDDTNVRIHRGTVADRDAFFRESDILLEMGSPTTACLESMAAGTPCLRISGPRDERKRKLGIVVLDGLQPWHGTLETICNNTRARRKLALTQFLALMRETRSLNA